MLRTVYIYTLSHPATKTVFYVGAAYNLSRRLKQHMNDATYYSRKQLTAYLNSFDGCPTIEVIDEISVNEKIDSIPLENYWIDQFRQWGFVLANNRHNLSKTVISDKLSDIEKAMK